MNNKTLAELEAAKARLDTYNKLKDAIPLVEYALDKLTACDAFEKRAVGGFFPGIGTICLSACASQDTVDISALDIKWPQFRAALRPLLEAKRAELRRLIAKA